jgi:hypothetical protein
VGALLPLMLLLPPRVARAGDDVARGAASAVAYEAAPAAAAKAPPAPTLPLVSLDLEAAAHCARSQSLVGDACSFMTGMTARRVLDEGVAWTWAGALTPRGIEGEIAAPFSAGGEDRILATELVETLVNAQRAASMCLFIGRSLEIDGVTWVVLTAYAPADT